MRAKRLPKQITYKGVVMFCREPNDMGYPIQTRIASGKNWYDELWSDFITYGQYDSWTEMYEAAYQHHKQLKKQRRGIK